MTRRAPWPCVLLRLQPAGFLEVREQAGIRAYFRWSAFALIFRRAYGVGCENCVPIDVMCGLCGV